MSPRFRIRIRSQLPLFQRADFRIREPQPLRGRERELLEDVRCEKPVLLRETVECRTRQEVQLRGGRCLGVGGTHSLVEKRHLAEELSAAERGNVVALAVLEGQEDVDAATIQFLETYVLHCVAC